VSGLCLAAGSPVLETVDSFDRERLLSVGDVAIKLRIATATVYGLCSSGKLPHVRILNVIRISNSDLRAFVAERRKWGGPCARRRNGVGALTRRRT
jgi:hypothetical protein